MIGNDFHRRPVLKRIDVTMHKCTKTLSKYAHPLRNSWLQTSHRWKERLSVKIFSMSKFKLWELTHIAPTKWIRYTCRAVVAQRRNPAEAKQQKKTGILSAVYVFLALWHIVQCYVAVCKSVSVPSSRITLEDGTDTVFPKRRPETPNWCCPTFHNSRDLMK